MVNDMTHHTPRELAEELGYEGESSPGIVVRKYLRKRYPEHPKNTLWILDEQQAADVRQHVPRRSQGDRKVT